MNERMLISMTLQKVQKQLEEDTKKKEAMTKDLRIKIADANQRTLDAQGELDTLLSKDILDAEAIEAAQNKIRTCQTIAQTYTKRLDNHENKISFEDASVYARQLYNAMLDEDSRLLSAIRPQFVAIRNNLAEYSNLMSSYQGTLSTIANMTDDPLRVRNAYLYKDLLLDILTMFSNDFTNRINYIPDMKGCSDSEIFVQRNHKV